MLHLITDYSTFSTMCFVSYNNLKHIRISVSAADSTQFDRLRICAFSKCAYDRLNHVCFFLRSSNKLKGERELPQAYTTECTSYVWVYRYCTCYFSSLTQLSTKDRYLRCKFCCTQSGSITSKSARYLPTTQPHHRYTSNGHILKKQFLKCMHLQTTWSF